MPIQTSSTLITKASFGIALHKHDGHVLTYAIHLKTKNP